MSPTRTLQPGAGRAFAATTARASFAAPLFAVLLSASLHASPQDALGTGRGLEHPMGGGTALDSGLGRGTGPYNAPRLQEDYRARNLIVTGNVAGGRGFRGSVGYTAETDFRGTTSDNATYAFRAASAFSDPRILRAGSYGDRLNMARSYGNIEYGRAMVPGSLAGVDLLGTRLRIDQGTARISLPTSRREMNEPTTAAIMDLGRDGRVRMLAGGFGGVRLQRDTDLVDSLNLGLYETARLKQDLRMGRLDDQLNALRYEDPLRVRLIEEAAGVRDPVTGEDAGADVPWIRGERIETGIRTMDEIVQALDRRLEETRYGTKRDAAELQPSTTPDRTGTTGVGGSARRPGEIGTPSGATGDTTRRRDSFARELERLRREMRGGVERRPLPGEEERDPFNLDRRRPEAAPAAEEKGDEDKQAEPTEEERRAQLDDLAAVLRHGKTVERLSDSMAARVREVISLGENAMLRGAFFNAEQHFSMALMLSPGNPLAQLGLANAQLGAGLVSSAAITLRNLYADHPEMIDVRQAPALLPSKERLKALLVRLGSTSVDARNAADVGLLLAYVGRQLGDRDAIERGLDMLKGGTSGDELLAALLRRIWVDEAGAAAAGDVGEGAPAALPAEPAPIDAAK